MLTLKRFGAATGSTPLENFAYNYNANKNQLNHLSGTFNGSVSGYLKSQSINNYLYNIIGQLTDDVAENLQQVYDVYGKVVQVKERSTGNLKVKFVYNAAGMRVQKVAYTNATNYTTTHYSYAGGALSAVYTSITTNGTTGATTHDESPIYGGGGRLGTAYLSGNAVTKYVFEVKDHLGNVRAAFRRTCLSCGGQNLVTVDNYADYYPYGWVLPGRNGSAGTPYRYGFQGEFAERDAETGWNAFELRMYESRVGRWMTVDPYEQFWSPYIGMGNDPINGVIQMVGKKYIMAQMVVGLKQQIIHFGTTYFTGQKDIGEGLRSARQSFGN